jgi:hypothetical protein
LDEAIDLRLIKKGDIVCGDCSKNLKQQIICEKEPSPLKKKMVRENEKIQKKLKRAKIDENTTPSFSKIMIDGKVEKKVIEVHYSVVLALKIREFEFKCEEEDELKLMIDKLNIPLSDLANLVFNQLKISWITSGEGSRFFIIFNF